MPVNRKSEGCWTCKLRRKKCDERQPTCATCDSLEITCAYGPKPSWMNGARRQQEMAEKLKNDIKRNTVYRRDKGNTFGNFGVISDMVAPNHTPSDTSESAQKLTTESDGRASPTPFALLPYEHRCSSTVEEQFETDFVMKYLDYVFPILFPFYQPGLFETGRSWLLLLLGKSRIAYHSTFSLASYFFTLALAEADEIGREFGGREFGPCKQMMWSELNQHTDKCFESIRTDMLALGLKSQSATATKLEKLEMMESVIQVLIFETALGKSGPCNSHLVAAFALLEDIMSISNRIRQDESKSKFCSVLLELGEPLWARKGYSQHIWSPHQAGLRFSAALLLFFDVVASTCCQEAPKLLSYHADILAQTDDGNTVVSHASVRLSNIVGCRNWAIRSIAQISALVSWKEEQSKNNALSVVELVERASTIASDLRDGILETRSCHIATPPSSVNRPTFDLRPDPSATFTSTLIWAYAAQLYLSVVVSGWQLSNTDIRANVTQLIELLQEMPTYQLRALPWPVCVAGCLALESEEQSFLALLSNQGKVYTTGALDDVRQIWERVWQTRASPRVSNWSLASCFNILGSPVLLV